jgi:hypothetical protein
MRFNQHIVATVAAGALSACTGAPGDDGGTTPQPSVEPATFSPSATTTHETKAPSPAASEVAMSTPTATPTEGGRLRDASECENEDLGYEVDYPEDWWANERVEPDDDNLTPIAACQFFAPDEVDLQPNAGLPNGVAIRFDLLAEAVVLDGEILSDDETTVDERNARVVEREPTPSPGFVPEGSVVYQYIIEFDGGRQLAATTDNIHQHDARYEEAKAILDAMMATLELDD